jgi:hypothetical protein
MTVTLKNKPPVVVPPAALRRAGFKRGQDLQFKASGGVISILPKLPSADGEYTPAQRRVIDARLKKAVEEVKRGQTAGPFDSAEDMIASLKRELRKSRTKKTKTTGR